jgi:hypothetical protein
VKISATGFRTSVLALTLAGSIAGAELAQGEEQSAMPLPKRTMVVERFAVAAPDSASSELLSAQACPVASSTGATNSTAATHAISVDPKLLDAITGDLQKNLAKTAAAITDVAPDAIPMNSLVITGCITKADAGNVAERVVGMNLGASHLAVHVRVLLKEESGVKAVNDFDIEVKGGNPLPPLGPIGVAIHAASGFRETLSADAEKLSKELLKRLAKDQKEQGT